MFYVLQLAVTPDVAYHNLGQPFMISVICRLCASHNVPPYQHSDCYEPQEDTHVEANRTLNLHVLPVIVIGTSSSSTLARFSLILLLLAVNRYTCV